jgi:hypothetical protein
MNITIHTSIAPVSVTIPHHNTPVTIDRAEVTTYPTTTLYSLYNDGIKIVDITINTRSGRIKNNPNTYTGEAITFFDSYGYPTTGLDVTGGHVHRCRRQGGLLILDHKGNHLDYIGRTTNAANQMAAIITALTSN